ncbi:hypothetical protein [Streptomyces sp. NPDC003635]
MDGTESVVLRITSSKYASDHQGWLGQVSQLSARLSELQVDPVEAEGWAATAVRLEIGGSESDEWAAAERPTGGGTKGILEASAILVSSAAMLRAVAVVLREWGKRDAGRSVSVEVTTSDGSVTAMGQGSAGIEAVRQTLAEAVGTAPEGRDGNR